MMAACVFIRNVHAQTPDVLQLPSNHVIGEAQALADRLLRIPDTTGDAIDDYLVGIPEARGGEGAIGVVTILDALDVLYAVGTQDTTKEQTGDCWVWIDDVEAVLELIE